MVVQNSLSFCLSEKLLISPSYLNEILAGYNNLGCRLLSFIILSEGGKIWENGIETCKISCIKPGSPAF